MLPYQSSNMPKALSPDKVNSILALLDSEHTHAQIMSRLGVSSGVISKICAKHRPHLPRSTGGRPRKLNPTAARYAVRLVTNQSTITTRQATKTLSELIGESVHPKTVRRVLKDGGLKSAKLIPKPKLTKHHINERLAFARAHRYWTVEDWKGVMWSDEVKINRLGSDGIHWVWIRPGEELSDRQVAPTANFGGGSLMFWGCMGWLGTGYGTRIDCNLTGEVYVEILKDEFLRSLAHLGFEPEGVVFQQDNARPHIAKVTLKWLEDHGIERLQWPANSPDLNPIENMWAELKRRLGEYEHPPVGMRQLWERVQDIWDGFGEDYCHRLIESMPRRMAMVLKKKGKWIPY